MAIGGLWRLPRVSPNKPVLYGKHVIPAGVGQSFPIVEAACLIYSYLDTDNNCQLLCLYEPDHFP